jgi:NAD+ kinase
MSDSFIPKKPVIVTYPRVTDSHAEADLIVAFLKAKGFDAPCGSLYDEELRTRLKNKEFDVLIAVGGDGTMLRAGHLCAPSGVPILGINFGRLGFLIQVERGEWREMLDRLFKGEAWLEHRMMLYVQHVRAGETRRQCEIHSFDCQRGRTFAHLLCLRRPDRFDRDRFNSLCAGRWRSHSPA